MTAADIVGVCIIIGAWLALIFLLGMWVGDLISRRNRRR